MDTSDPDLSAQARASGEDPLLRALRDENQRLRSRNRELTEKMAPTRAAHEELARLLRVTAPLRRVQESLRLRTGEKRRRAEQSAPSPWNRPPPRPPPTDLAITD